MSIREFGVMGLFPDEEIAKHEMKIRRISPAQARLPGLSQNETDYKKDYTKQRNTRKENAK